MIRTRILAIALVAVAGLASVSTRASEDPRETRRTAKQLFDQMKTLVGTWEAKGMGTVTYRLTAADSTLVETLFAGTPKEMMTLYHVDGDDLVLTHYCAIGNQPRMKASTGSKTRIAFEFAGGGNLDPAVDEHMHSLALKFVDAKHVVADWVLWAKGKPAQTVSLEMEKK